MIQLLDLLEEHREAFDYDWRTRFGLSADVIGEEMDWREACSLTRALIADGTSRVGAAVAGWRYPWTPEAWILADLWDLIAAVHTDRRRRPKPYPRPTDEMHKKKFGRTALPQHVVRAALAARGHKF